MRPPHTLKDLPGVMVVVEDFRSAAGDAGFDSRTFQTDVELKLRLAGIKAAEDADLPQLYLNVNTLHRERSRNDAYGVSLRLIQRVLLESQLHSDPEKSTEEALATSTTLATTWSTGSLGFGSVADVRAAVKDRVDMFINDWLEVNPLKQHSGLNSDGT